MITADSRTFRKGHVSSTAFVVSSSGRHPVLRMERSTYATYRPILQSVPPSKPTLSGSAKHANWGVPGLFRRAPNFAVGNGNSKGRDWPRKMPWRLSRDRKWHRPIMKSPPKAGFFWESPIFGCRPECVVEAEGVELSAYHPVVEPVSKLESGISPMHHLEPTESFLRANSLPLDSIIF